MSGADSEEKAGLGMEPLAPTREAMAQLDPTGDEGLLERLSAAASRARQLVPACVGVSLTMLVEEITLTFVATGHDVATLDGVQYLAGGPCADIATDPVAQQYTTEELAERDWQLFADASSAVGVASTLTLPILGATGSVLGSVNFYGATPHCFDDHHQRLAEMFSAWAPAAVTNADLPFRTRDTAAQAPKILREHAAYDKALGVIAAREGIGVDEAERFLQDAAARAGVDPSDLAEAVLRSAHRKQG